MPPPRGTNDIPGLEVAGVAECGERSSDGERPRLRARGRQGAPECCVAGRAVPAMRRT
jgi:hypothetical protein